MDEIPSPLSLFFRFFGKYHDSGPPSMGSGRAMAAPLYAKVPIHVVEILYILYIGNTEKTKIIF